MNWLDPSKTPVQLLSAVLMFAALGMSVAIPYAFGDGAPIFVGCYLFMGVLRPVFMVLGAILVAVSTELRLSHDHLTPAIVVVTVAGPVVYLIGNLLFLRSRRGVLAVSRVVAMLVLLAIGAVALLIGEALPILWLSIALLAVTAVLAALTIGQRRRGARD